MTPNRSPAFPRIWKWCALSLLLAVLWTSPADASTPQDIATRSPVVAKADPEQTKRPDILHNDVAKRPATGTQVPWLFITAFGCALFVFVPLLPRVRRPRNRATAAGLLLLAPATFVFRRLVFPEAFFHQNGHGAMWIDCALGGRCSYGKGFSELFGMAAALGDARPESGVFIANGILAALAVVAAWVLARAAGAPRAVAWALAIVMAVEPGLGRLAQSESYFGVIAWLLLIAAALLASGARSGKVMSSMFAASVLGAGLLVSEAALVHPIAWVPAAFVPLAAWVGPGALRRRTRLFLAATAGIGLVALGASGPEMLGILQAQAHWTGGFADALMLRAASAFAKALAYAVFLLVLLGLSRLRSDVGAFARIALRWTLRLGALLVVVGVCDTLNPVRHLTPWLIRAWWIPYLPALVATGASLTHRLKRPAHARIAGGLVLVAGIAFTTSGWHQQTLLPADAREAQFAKTWREMLPRGAEVIHLERADDQISVLPVFRGSGVSVLRLDLAGKLSPIERAKDIATHYHRSSLCSTPQGKPFCDEFESEWDLEPVAVTELPAIPSFPYMPYSESPVRVGLYRIHRSAPVSETR